MKLIWLKLKSHFSIFKTLTISMLVILFTSSCTTVKMKLFTDTRDPLNEYILAGSGRNKIVVIPIAGLISDVPSWSLFKTKGSMVQEIVSQLNLAASDSRVKAIVLKINSPGGTVTGSDVLYHELNKFKKKTGIKVVVMMMDMATSGGYYAAMPADHIVAHPTTVTGSIGVIFMRPKLYSLMNKIGVEVDINKSGKNKDMGSPFRKATDEENKLFESLISKLGTRFITLVEKHRKLSPEAREKVKSAQIFLAEDALKLNLIDEIGYIDAAITKAANLAKIPKDSRIVVYRRSHYPDDNIYNTTSSHYKSSTSILNLGMFNELKNLQAGFYYVWHPGLPE